MLQQIIIVSGDTHFQNTLKRICSGQDCLIKTTDSLLPALAIADRAPVCVLVADVSIHEVDDGLELAHIIHEQNPGARCFLLTSDDSSDELLAAEENEPWLRLVHKPISMLKFAVDIVEAIKNSNEED